MIRFATLEEYPGGNAKKEWKDMRRTGKRLLDGSAVMKGKERS
jgi:hypothetical protein